MNQRKLAELAGVSTSTVSLVMRNSPRISESTRKRILALAKQHHYYPDIRLSQLRSEVRDNEKSTLLNIGLITPIADRARPQDSRIFQGIRDRAKELGHAFDEFPIIGDLETERRLEQVLSIRNMDGIIFYHLMEGSAAIGLHLNNISSLALGYSISKPALNRIAFDHFHGITLALSELEKAGYRRIGLCLRERANTSSRNAWLLGWKAFVADRAPEDFPEPLIAEQVDFNRFSQWFKQVNPDVILSDGLHMKPLDWLKSMKLGVPEDVGFASLHISKTWQGVSGLTQNDYLQGQFAVDTLIQQIWLNEKGAPTHPRNTLVQGRWVHGSTTLKQPSIQTGSSRASQPTAHTGE